MVLPGGVVVAQRFDEAKEEVVGDPVPLDITMPKRRGFSSRSLAVTLERSARLLADKAQRLAPRLVDRKGVEQDRRPLGRRADLVLQPDLSPDGSRFAVSEHEAGEQRRAWVHDLVRGFSTRLTSGEDADDTLPLWSPDGREIAFSRIGSGGTTGIYRMAADLGPAANASGSPGTA
ncbi:MAG: hypothetical protein R2862_09980 [Thermoanaerobaculia bacterium]